MAMSIDNEDFGASELDLFLGKGHGNDRQRRRWPWVISTSVLATLSLVLSLIIVIGDKQSPREVETQAWLESDFPASREAIEFQQVLFTGNSAYDESGRFYVPHPPPISYTGEPSVEIDNAWQNLTGERDFMITRDEAFTLWGEQMDEHWHVEKQGYLIGIDMFHTLHCLDNLRKMFYPEYYPIKDKYKDAAITHRAHCIDQIRQYVMCAGDMTPYGTRYFKNPGRNYADSDVVHTCRNFEKIREWTRQRYHAGGGLHIPGVEIWD